MVRLFLDDTRSQLERLHTAMSAADRRSAGHIAHHIEGAAENLDLTDLARAARALRISLDASEAENPPPAASAQRLYREFQEVEKTLDIR